MIRTHLQSVVSNTVAELVKTGQIPAAEFESVEIADPRSPEHGDYTTNFAMVNAKKLGMNPRAVAEALAAALSDHPDFETVEVAGPGFINLRLKPEAVSRYVAEVLAKGVDLPRTPSPSPQRINVEFVSVNPNGPITVGSGRGAAFGSALCNVLEAAGHQVHREYYVNDGVNSTQMRLFAESVRSYIEGTPFPEKGYKGDYVQAVAEQIAHSDKPEKPTVAWYQETSQTLMLAAQRQALTAFGVEFDTWFSEQSLHDGGVVNACIADLEAHGVADVNPVQYAWLAEGAKSRPVETPNDEEEENAFVEQIPAPDEVAAVANPPRSSRADFKLWAKPQANTNTLWLRSTKFGDDMDRVVRRKDGRLTYIASDVAYHKDKFNRPENADKLITILGPDHHGYIGRLQAVLAALLREGGDTLESNKAALEQARNKLEVVIFQLVRFLKDGKQAPMRKRDGNIYALFDLIDELGKTMAPNAPEEERNRIGRDVARFFYLMRSHDTNIDFDLDLATKQSDENPVFYAQYAHARICSVMRKAAESDLRIANSDSVLSAATRHSPIANRLLTHPKELALIKKIVDLPYEVRRCSEDYGVHRLTTYAVELARTYHGFYDNCRVILPENPELSQARLALCQATRLALQSTFNLLGISAPERMERDAAANSE